MIPKTPDNFKIIHKDGTEYDMADDLFILVQSFKISSLSPNYYTEKIEGRNGPVRISKDYNERRMTAVCTLFGIDHEDYLSLFEDRLQDALFPDDPFYIIVDSNTSRRWVAEVANEWTPDRIGSSSEFQIDFVAFYPFAESILTTADPSFYAAQLSSEGSREIKYKHSTTTFEILNDGRIEIDPREQPLVITFTGPSTNLIIRNLTTGDEWGYTGTSNPGDDIVLDGIRATKNGLSIFGDTNRKLISIAKGWNSFELIGTTGAFEIAFDFRVYTK